jgi:CPA2 family monovalent cation:H+ antiporter-2
MMCISSTTIILKVFDEKGLKSRSFAQLVTGILIVEDLVAVLLLVMLSTVAVRRQFSGIEMAWAGLRLSFFLTIWFVVGLLALPRILKMVRKLLNEETTLIVAVGLCLLMVLIAAESGFSPALGAFVMGSLLAETSEGGRIEKLLHPLRDFFAAVFFVSVGMLFNPTTFADQWPWVLIMAAILIVGKTLAVSFGAVLSGQSLSTSVKAGLSLTQIGEFSFIIAALGTQLGVISKEHYPMAVAVSLLTSFTTPYCVSVGPALVQKLERIMPPKWREALIRYQSRVQQEGSERDSILRLRSYFLLISINLVLIFAVSWIMRHLFYSWITSWWGDQMSVRTLGFLLAFTAAAPFFYGLCWRRPQAVRGEGPIVGRITQMARLVLGLVVSLFVAGQYVSWSALSGFAILAVVSFGVLIYRFGGRAYRGLETRLLDQISGRAEVQNAAPSLAPWDAHMSELLVDSDSPLAGKSIGEIGAQETFGVVIAAFESERAPHHCPEFAADHRERSYLKP